MNKAEKMKAWQELIDNPINVFGCCGKTFEFNKFVNHLKDEHKLDPEKIKGKKSLTMHMDGDYWYSSDYQWELKEGLKFSQHTKNAREIDDPMAFNF